MECNLPYNPSLAINFSFTLPMAAKKKKKLKKVDEANRKIYDKWPEHISTPKDRSCKTNVQLFHKFDSCRQLKATLRGALQFSITFWAQWCEEKRFSAGKFLGKNAAAN